MPRTTRRPSSPRRRASRTSLPSSLCISTRKPVRPAIRVINHLITLLPSPVTHHRFHNYFNDPLRNADALLAIQGIREFIENVLPLLSTTPNPDPDPTFSQLLHISVPDENIDRLLAFLSSRNSNTTGRHNYASLMSSVVWFFNQAPFRNRPPASPPTSTAVTTHYTPENRPELIDQLACLARDYPPVRFNQPNNVLTFVIPSARIISGRTTYEFGDFLVSLNFDSLLDCIRDRIRDAREVLAHCIKFEALHLNPYHPYPAHPHPHISNERLCFGEGVALAKNLLCSGSFLDLADLIKSILNTSGTGPYVALTEYGPRTVRCGACRLEHQTSLTNLRPLISCTNCGSVSCVSCLANNPVRPCVCRLAENPAANRTFCRICIANGYCHQCPDCLAFLCSRSVCRVARGGTYFCHRCADARANGTPYVPPPTPPASEVAPSTSPPVPAAA